MQKLEEEKISVDLTKHNVSKEEGAVHRENVRIGKLEQKYDKLSKN